MLSLVIPFNYAHLKLTFQHRGKRYARTDEIGVPFAVTVDYQFQTDNTVTLRERDSMAQVRVPIPEVPTVIRALVNGTLSWEEVESKFPKQEAKATDEAE